MSQTDDDMCQLPVTRPLPAKNLRGGGVKFFLSLLDLPYGLYFDLLA